MADLNERWLALGHPWGPGMRGHSLGGGVPIRFLAKAEPGAGASLIPDWNDHATVGALWGLAAAVREASPESAVMRSWNEAIWVSRMGPTDPRVVPFLLGVLEAGKTEGDE